MKHDEKYAHYKYICKEFSLIQCNVDDGQFWIVWFQLLPRDIVDVTMHYMAFIDTFDKGDEGGKKPTYNSSITASSLNNLKISMGSTEISYIAYTGITMSMVGLLIMMTSLSITNVTEGYQTSYVIRFKKSLKHLVKTVFTTNLNAETNFFSFQKTEKIPTKPNSCAYLCNYNGRNVAQCSGV